MDHFKGHPKFGILVFEGVIAVGGIHNDFFHAMIDEGLDVFPGQALEQFLVTRFADAFPAAVLLGTQYPEGDTGLVEDSCCGLGHPL
jgi:hypothetical protein